MLFGATVAPHSNKLQHLQNRAIEIIHSDFEPADLNAALKDLSLLNVQQMIDFNTATTVYDSIQNTWLICLYWLNKCITTKHDMPKTDYCHPT